MPDADTDVLKDKAPEKKVTFVGLEGLRGLAAIAVLLYHFPDLHLFPSAYLAVDLFFLLSGFVIAYSYDAKLGRSLSAGSFLIKRTIRLYPLYLLGTLLSFALVMTTYLFGSTSSHPYATEFRHLAFALFALPSLAVAGGLYPLNPPAWSLFFEFLGNALFAILAPNPRWRLWLIVIVSAPLLGWHAWTENLLNYGAIWQTWLWGIPRVTFSFFLGAIMFSYYREGRLTGFRCPPELILLLLLALCCIPTGFAFYGVFTWAIIVFLFPVMVTLAIVNEPAGISAWIMRLLGQLSYPLYMLHTGLLILPEMAARKLGLSTTLTVAAFMPVIFILSWLALKWFDEPVRRQLARLSPPARSPDLCGAPSGGRAGR